MIEKEHSAGQTDASAPEGLAGEPLRAGQLFSHQIWETTADAMVLSDPNGIVLDANPAYLRLYGYTLAQIQGQSFAIIFPEELRGGRSNSIRLSLPVRFPLPALNL